MNIYSRYRYTIYAKWGEREYNNNNNYIERVRRFGVAAWKWRGGGGGWEWGGCGWVSGVGCALGGGGGSSGIVCPIRRSRRKKWDGTASVLRSVPAKGYAPAATRVLCFFPPTKIIIIIIITHTLISRVYSERVYVCVCRLGQVKERRRPLWRVSRVLCAPLVCALFFHFAPLPPRLGAPKEGHRVLSRLHSFVRKVKNKIVSFHFFIFTSVRFAIICAYPCVCVCLSRVCCAVCTSKAHARASCGDFPTWVYFQRVLCCD